MQKILIDGDSCPVMDVAIQWAHEFDLECVVVCCAKNRRRTGDANLIVVPNERNGADKMITKMAEPGDIVITDDVQLAKRCHAKDVTPIKTTGSPFGFDRPVSNRSHRSDFSVVVPREEQLSRREQKKLKEELFTLRLSGILGHTDTSASKTLRFPNRITPEERILRNRIWWQEEIKRQERTILRLQNECRLCEEERNCEKLRLRKKRKLKEVFDLREESRLEKEPSRPRKSGRHENRDLRKTLDDYGDG